MGFLTPLRGSNVIHAGFRGFRFTADAVSLHTTAMFLPPLRGSFAKAGP